MGAGWVLWMAGCSCAMSHELDAAPRDGGLDAASFDAPPDTPRPDSPRLDAPCIETLAVTATGTVMGSSAERFTSAQFDGLYCDGSHALVISLFEEGRPFDGSSISVSWGDAPLQGPDPVRDVDVPVSVAWGSGLGPGGSIMTTMHVTYAEPWDHVWPLSLVASLTVDHGSDHFQLGFDFAYCTAAVCL